MRGYPLLAAMGLALGALVVYIAYVRARRARAQVDLLHVFAEVGQMLSTASATAEAQALPVFAIALTGVLSYLSFLGASLVHSTECRAVQVLMGMSAAALLAGHLLLAFQAPDRERMQNRPLFLLMLAFGLVSVSFAYFGLYGTVVAGDLTSLEISAWQDYYRESRTILVTQTGALRSAAAALCADANAKLLVFQNEAYNARLENRPFIDSPEQAALANAEERAADWQRSLMEFELPPPTPAPGRQKAEADLVNCVDGINRLAAGAPSPLAPRGVQIGRYVAGTTEPFARALEALKRREPSAMSCIALCGGLEAVPLAVLLMLRRRGYLREFIEGVGEGIVMVRRVLLGSWREGGARFIAEECRAILVVFRPAVHPELRFEWNRQPPLAESTFGQVCDAILPDIESKLSAAGYRLSLFVNADLNYIAYDLPVLTQLKGGVLIALCERVHPNT